MWLNQTPYLCSSSSSISFHSMLYNKAKRISDLTSSGIPAVKIRHSATFKALLHFASLSLFNSNYADGKHCCLIAMLMHWSSSLEANQAESADLKPYMVSSLHLLYGPCQGCTKCCVFQMCATANNLRELLQPINEGVPWNASTATGVLLRVLS